MTKKKNLTAKTVGRPRKELSKAQIAKVEELSEHLTIQQIADCLEMSESTFKRLKTNNLDLLTSYKKGKAKGIKYVSGKLRELIDAGDTTATIFYLKTQAGWSEKQKLDVTTTDTSNMQFTFITDGKNE